MYKNFYRMQTEAFISLPLPDVFFHSRTHKIAWNYLVYGIKSHEPYLLVAGDYGMGKTLLCLKLVKALQKKEMYPFSYISNSNYSYTTIVREIVKQLGLEIKKEEESSLQGLLYEYFENQKPIQPFYCIIDDVQEFDPMTLVKLRLLANFNHYGVFPIRMIFFAHTSFIERLKSPSMRPLDQRIKRKYSLVPFDLSETKEYIYFRLLNAGAIMSPYFTDNAIEQLFDYTGGIPRLINNICDACLLIGASREMNEIDSSLVEEALEYLGWRSESEDSQEVPYFEEEKEQTTGSDQVVEQMEPDDTVRKTVGKISDAIDKHETEKQTSKPKEPISRPQQKKVNNTETVFTRDYIRERPLSDKLITLLTPDSISAEMFKVIRGMILYNQNRLAPKAIMVTSALPGEGKTFVASNLAVSFARSLNENVLLIDSDLRRPSVHKMFGYANEYGLSDHLRGRKDIPELLINTEIEQLTLLLSGEPPSNPVELLSSKKMGDFIKEAKNRYQDRFIIVDATPSRITAETNVIANHVDGIILVVMNGKTPRALLQQTVENLERKKILGIVFNDYAQPSKYYHKYYRKYYK